MQMFEVVTALNSQFLCSRCHAGGSWAVAARPMTRQNSVIHQVRCMQCGERAVAKVGGGKLRHDDARLELQNEYATLRALRAAFSCEEGLGILEPLGYMEVAGRGVLVTHWFAGNDLVRYARSVGTPALEQAFRLGGAWLLKLHNAEEEDRPLRSLGVAEKIESLSRTYGGVLRTHSRARKACELLASVGCSLEALAVRPVRIHGDFKPQNMLYDGTCCVGLDIHWKVIGAAVYDVAPFLNHLWLAGVGKQGLSAETRYLQAEAALLAGYTDTVPMKALRWAQLYFALCHLGGYRQRGGLAVVYANWKIWPLIQRLQGQLWEAA